MPRYYAGGRLHAGWFATWARQEAEALAPEAGGTATLRTTLWPELQAIAAKRLARALREDGPHQGFDQGAVLVMSLAGEVLAMVRGRDFRTSQWNKTTQAKRQPGSAFKPFVYLGALGRGLRPDELVEDAPLDLDGAAIRNSTGATAAGSRSPRPWPYRPTRPPSGSHAATSPRSRRSRGVWA